MLISSQDLTKVRFRDYPVEGVRSKWSGKARNLERDYDIVPTPEKSGAARKSDVGVKMQNCSIYGLVSSEDNIVRYIGQTMRPLEKRLNEHKSCKKSCISCYRWIRKVIANGYEVRIELLEENCHWNDAERKWIAEYRKNFPGVLLNWSDGGCGYSGLRSEEVKMNMRKPKSESHKAAMRKPKSEQAKQKMSLAQVGNNKSKGEANKHAILTIADVVSIKKFLVDGKTLTTIAGIYGVKKSAISKIKTGRNWNFVTI